MNGFTQGLHLIQHESGQRNWGELMNQNLAEVDRALSALGARPLFFDKRVRSLQLGVTGRSVSAEAITFEKDGTYVSHEGGEVIIPVGPGPGDRMDLLVIDPETDSGLIRIQGTPANQWQRNSARFVRVFDKTNAGLGSLVAPGAMLGLVADVLYDPVQGRWLLAYLPDLGAILSLPSAGPPIMDLAVFDPSTAELTPLNMNWRLPTEMASFGELFVVSPFGLSVLPNSAGTGIRIFAFAGLSNGFAFLEFDQSGEAIQAWGLTNGEGNLFTSGPMQLMDLGPDTQNGGRNVRVVGVGMGVLPWHGLNLGSFTCEARLPDVPSAATLGGEIFPMPIMAMPITGALSQFGPEGSREAISLTLDERRNKIFTLEVPLVEGGLKQELPKESVFNRPTDPPWKFFLSSVVQAAAGLSAYALNPEPDVPIVGASVNFPDAIAIYDSPVMTDTGFSPATAFFQGPDLVVSWPAGGGNIAWYPWPALGDSMAVLVEYSTGFPTENNGEKNFAVLSGPVGANPAGQGGTDGLVLGPGLVLKGEFPEGNQITLHRIYLGRVISGGSTFSARLIHVDGVPLEDIAGRLIKVTYDDPAGEGSFTWLARAGCPLTRPYHLGVKGYGGTGAQGSVALCLLAFPGDLWLTYEGNLSSSNGRGVPFGTMPLGLELAGITQNQITIGPYGGAFVFDAGTLFFYDDGFDQYQWQDPAAGPTQLPRLSNGTLTSGSPIADYRQLDSGKLFVIPPQPAWNFTHRVLADPAKYSLELVGRLLPEETNLPAPVFSAFGAPTGVGYGDGDLFVSTLSLNSLPGGAVSTWEPFETPAIPATPPGLVPVALVLVRGGQTAEIASQDLMTGPEQGLPVINRATLLATIQQGIQNQGDLLGGLSTYARLLKEGLL